MRFVSCFCLGIAFYSLSVAQTSPTWKPIFERDKEYPQRLQILKALAPEGKKVVSEADLRMVASALSDPAGFVQTTAFFLLNDRKSEATFRAIVSELAYAEVNQGAQLLSGYPSDKYVKRMLPLLNNSDERVRRIAIDGLGLTMNRKAFWALISALPHLEAPLRWRVSIAAMRFRDEPHRKAALKLLTDKNPRCRDVAADMVGIWQEPRAVDQLVRLLRDKDAEVAWSAQVALGSYSDSKTRARVFKEFSSSDDLRRGLAAKILGFQKASEYIDPLFKAMLDDSSEAVRQDCFHALIAIGRPSIAKFKELILYPIARERGTAVMAFGQIADPLGKEPLLKSISDPDLVVRMLSATALASFRGDDVIAALEQAEKDPEVRVRDAATTSLRKIRT